MKLVWEKAFANRTREEIINLVKSVGGDGVPIMDYPSLLTIHKSRRSQRSWKSIIQSAERFKAVRASRAIFGNPERYPYTAAGAWAAYRRGPARGGTKLCSSH
jgi:hypothetical protein